jgi:prevent-host-death family protein
MKFYTVTEFKAKATGIISEIERTQEEIIVTKNGKPTVLVRLIDEGEFQLVPNKKGIKRAKGQRKKKA